MKTTYAIYLGIFPAELRACEKIRNPLQRRGGAEDSRRTSTARIFSVLSHGDFLRPSPRLHASAVGFQEYSHRH